MASKRLATCAIPMGLLIALLAGGSAVAQKKAEPKEIETITVVAPRITYREVRPKDGSVIPKEVTIARKTALVSYADLNLSRTADLYILEDRIHRAAAQICRELAQEVPDGEPDIAICTDRAGQDAMAHLRQTTRRQMATRP